MSSRPVAIIHQLSPVNSCLASIDLWFVCMYCVWCWQDDDGGGADKKAADKKKNKKRRRTEVAEAKAKVEQRKQIVRIRAKVHCTSAGLPGLDAPVRSKGKDTKGDDATSLPDWHPLQKVGSNPCVLVLFWCWLFLLWLS